MTLSVGARTNRHADLAAGDDGGLPADLLDRFPLQDVCPRVVHRVLYRPPDAERLHPLQCLRRCIVEVCDRPSQRSNRKFPIDPLPDAEELIDVRLGIPMHRDREATLRGPADNLVVLRLVCLRWDAIDAVHRPRDALADAVEVQHRVAKALRHHGEVILVLGEFGAVRHAAQAVCDAYGELSIAPYLEQRLIFARRDVVASGVDDPRYPEPIELAEEGFRSGNLFVERRLRQPVEQLDQVARNRSRQLAVRTSLERITLGQIRVAIDV